MMGCLEDQCEKKNERKTWSPRTDEHAGLIRHINTRLDVVGTRDNIPSRDG
jgi:hypothetical protein